ncbi:hypothetical protein COBT_000306 [Conglomerata obtusa]
MFTLFYYVFEISTSKTSHKTYTSINTTDLSDVLYDNINEYKSIAEMNENIRNLVELKKKIQKDIDYLIIQRVLNTVTDLPNNSISSDGKNTEDSDSLNIPYLLDYAPIVLNQQEEYIDAKIRAINVVDDEIDELVKAIRKKFNRRLHLINK